MFQHTKIPCYSLHPLNWFSGWCDTAHAESEAVSHFNHILHQNACFWSFLSSTRTYLLWKVFSAFSSTSIEAAWTTGISSFESVNTWFRRTIALLCQYGCICDSWLVRTWLILQMLWDLHCANSPWWMIGDRITQRSISVENQIVRRIHGETMCRKCFTVESAQSQSDVCMPVLLNMCLKSCRM